MTTVSETFFGRLGAGIYEFWLNWGFLIVIGAVLIGGGYLLMRWLLWKLPDFFLEREPGE